MVPDRFAVFETVGDQDNAAGSVLEWALPEDRTLHRRRSPGWDHNAGGPERLLLFRREKGFGDTLRSAVGKIPPDNLAEVAYRWAVLYKAFVGIDITGGMGVATARKFQEMGYKNMYIEGINTQNIWEYNATAMEKIPGVNFNNKRTQIVAAFEEQLRHGFIIRSQRLVNEMNTFVYVNGRPDHMKGTHDDAIMSCAIALYIADMNFGQLERVDSVNKSILDSWMISERTYEPNKSFYSQGQAFDPMGSMSTDGDLEGNPLFQNDQVQTLKQQYQEFSWLFHSKKKQR